MIVIVNLATSRAQVGKAADRFPKSQNLLLPRALVGKTGTCLLGTMIFIICFLDKVT